MESAEDTKTKRLRIISIKKEAPRIYCVETDFSKAPQNLERFVKGLINGRSIESVQKKELVVEYTFNLADNAEDLLVGEPKKEKTKPREQEVPKDLIKIAITEYGEELIKLGISCKGAEAEPRRNIERLVKILNKTGTVSKRKSHLFEGGICRSLFNYS